MSEFLCKEGKLIIDDAGARVVAPLNRIIWMFRKQDYKGIESRPGGLMQSIVTFHTMGGAYKTKLPTRYVNKIIQELA